ncbi:MAG TPA: AAA family ATPase, partial [Thermoanaerobaculia bacterium]|nr:AAA family ATPase [Thermoanaerobaculia bacterium]
MKQVQQAAQAVLQQLETVIYGKRPVLELVLACLLAEGHLLLEDVPGTAKTLLAKTLARTLGGGFRRLQCTPDLLPGDVTGSSVFNQKTGNFEFHPGPVFTQILLADEINRATPRAQAALLECMAERQVSVDNRTYPLKRPFFVIATQNPIEHEGTFPLPEAQLDRFLMRLSIGYPNLQAARRQPDGPGGAPEPRRGGDRAGGSGGVAAGAPQPQGAPGPLALLARDGRSRPRRRGGDLRLPDSGKRADGAYGLPPPQHPARAVPGRA